MKKELGGVMRENRRRIKKLAAILTVILFIATGPVIAVPVIGGDPIFEQANDDFSGGQTEWSLSIYSYVFDDTSSSLPGNFALDPGEMLFMYLLDSPSETAVSIDYFSVGNPDLVSINNFGYEDQVVPQGYDAADRQDPYIYGHLLTTEGAAMVYVYAFNPIDPDPMLDPGEYSLVYYIAVAPGYTQVPASASGGGVGDNGLVPGPIPEPATIFLLGLGALALVRKRKP